MSLVYKKAVRDLRELGVRALFVAACLGLGVAVYVGGGSARDSLFHTRDTYFERLHLSDLQIVLSPPADASELPDLSKVPGVKAYVKRLAQLGTIEMADGSPLSIVTVNVDPKVRPEVNSLELLEGRFLDPTRKDEVVIEKTMRDVLGFKVGDRITLDPYVSPLEVTIVGVAISPEFLLPTANPDVLLPAKGSLGVVFISIERIAETFGEPMYNDLSFLAAAGTTIPELTEAVRKALGPLPIERITPREQQFGYRYLQEDLKSFDIFIPVSVGLFAFVTAVVLLLSVNRLVAAQEREIGALLAQGFRARQLALGFLFMSGLVALLGIAGGLLLAPFVRDLFALQYAHNVGLPEPLMLLPMGTVLRAAGAGLFATLAFTCLPLLRIARLEPQRVLRGSVQETFVAPSRFGAWFTSLLAGKSATRRHAVRNLLRRPRLTAAVVLLIALSIGLATAFRLSQSAWTRYAREAFANEHWDTIVSFRVPLADKDVAPIAATPGITNVRPLVVGTASVVEGDRHVQLRLVGIPQDKPSRYLAFTEGGFFTGEDAAEIVLNNNFTGGHRFHAGVTVDIETSTGERFPARVTGVFSDVTMGVAYLPVGFARRVLGRPEKSNGIFADVRGDPRAVKKALFGHEMVQYVNLKSEMEAQTWEYMKVMWTLVSIALALSVLLGIMFVLTGLSLTLLEREGEYATLRSIGFANRPVAGIIMWEVALQGVMAAFSSIPLSYAMSTYLENEMARAWLKVPLVFDPLEMFLVALPVLAFLPLAALPGIRHVLRIDLVQSLRRRSFG